MKKSWKKVFALLLCCILAISLFACGKTETPSGTPDANNPAPNSATPKANDKTPDPAAPVKDSLVVAMSQDSGTLDPMFNIGWDCMNALRMVYEPLWEFDSNREMIYVLATGIDYISPTVWRVHLREGVTFENGNTFNADDAIFTFQRANNRPGATPLLTYLDTEKTSKVDDYTIELVFTQYRVGNDEMFASIYLFDKESFNEDTVTTKTNGTGPFVLTEQVINSQWVVTRRDNYWGEKPALKTISFKVLVEDTQKVNALQTDTVDISTVPFQDISYVQSLDNVEVSLMQSGTSKVLYMNLNERTPFHDNDDARMAVALAVDRQAIIDIAYSGYATISRLPVAVGKLDTEDRILDYGVYGSGQNIELAKQLAISSGLVDKEILLINNGASDSKIVAEIVQDALKEIGVKVNITTLDPGSWLGVVFDASQWDMAVDFTLGNSTVQAYNMWANMHGGGSFIANDWVGSKRFYELDAIAITEPDAAKRSDMLLEMTQLLADGLIWYSLCDIQSAVAYDKGLQGFEQLNNGSVVYYRMHW